MEKNTISKNFAEDSVLSFKDGQQIKGSNDVSEAIIDFCESYLQGYKNAEKREFVTGICSVVVITGICLGATYIVKHKKKSKNIKEEEA